MQILTVQAVPLLAWSSVTTFSTVATSDSSGGNFAILSLTAASLMAEPLMSWRAEGGGLAVIGEEPKIAVNLSLKSFRESEGETELQLPFSLLSTERAYVHKVAGEMGLQSKSRGMGQARYGGDGVDILIILSCQVPACIQEGGEHYCGQGCCPGADRRISPPHLVSAIQVDDMVVESIVTITICRCPVAVRDRVELVPGMEKVVGRSVMGRLGGGVPQVPPAPACVGGEYL